MSDVKIGQVWRWPERPVACGKWCHRCGGKHAESARDLRVVLIEPPGPYQRVQVENVKTKRKTWIRAAAFLAICAPPKGET